MKYDMDVFDRQGCRDMGVRSFRRECTHVRNRQNLEARPSTMCHVRRESLRKDSELQTERYFAKRKNALTQEEYLLQAKYDNVGRKLLACYVDGRLAGIAVRIRQKMYWQDYIPSIGFDTPVRVPKRTNGLTVGDVKILTGTDYIAKITIRAIQY